DIFKAEVYFRRAIKLDPDMIDAYQGLGEVLFGAKHLLPAAQIYEEALRRAPNRLPLLLNLAKARMMLKEAGEAEHLARRILSIDERCSDAWGTLAWALLCGGGDAGEALAAAEQAASIAPADTYAPALREQALRRLGRTTEADAAWCAILDSAARDGNISRGLNEVYYWLNQLDRCQAVARAFVEANPDRPEGLKDLATLMMADGRFDLAQQMLDRAGAIAPDHKAIRMVTGLNAFRLGDYKRGLELYAARWSRNTHDRPWDIPVPEWDGQPIDGRLVIYCEQGIGDYVMFALLFSEARRYARSITIEVNSRIASLFRRSFPDMRVIDRNALPPDWDPSLYQAKVGMGDLFSRLPIDLEKLPNRKGFLIPEPALALKLRERYRALFPGKRLVGISWRSGNRDSATIRSIDLTLWGPIFETPDCAFISLQYGDIGRDIETLRAETGHLVHWDREVDPMHYLDPFTAQIAAMDLVVSVDNSTVHFAGAIGKPCWVLLPVNSDWRWLTQRTKSIWYESLDLIRQQRSEGWEQVIAKVADRLRAIGTEPLIDAQAELCLRCGEELLRREAMGPAEDYFRWLLETGRHKASALHGIGKAAQKARHFHDAAAILGRAAELAPDCVAYKADWLVALFEAGHRDMAERMARDLTRQSNDPVALMAMGQILAAKGLLDQATDYFARVLRSDPDHVTARTILAGLQALQGEDELAHRNFARLVRQAPDLAGPRTALAEIDLRQERDEAAWPNFAWRFGAAPEELPRHLAMIAPDERPKSWSGRKIRRRRLFLRAERNAVEQLLFAPWFGDALQDSRAVRAECHPAALRVLSAAFPNVGFAGAGTLTPDDLIADRTQVATSLGDLVPLYAHTSVGNWLPFDHAAAAARRRELLEGAGANRLVGLAWQPDSSPHSGLQSFAPLFAAAGIRWVALPMGAVAPALAQMLSAPDSPLAFRTSWSPEDLESASRLLAALDLLVSAEDLAATLAGALGKPVWKIAGAGAHWSWLAQGRDSKWHPTARIYRAAAGLEPPMAELRADLEHFTET
ncbi:MAG TPA: tetratricopeptide repeat protein, partial [Dongiaceae bacterium]|nr:tetratricopeptide repeat protein [Dongiaceae bacterium]